MIRFIDIRNQGTCNRFAFYNTSTGRFVDVGGEQAWTNWDEFEEEWGDKPERERFWGLCPDWAFDDEEDDIEKWYES